MSRPNKVLAWLIAIVVVLAILYASVPWLLGSLIKQQLAAQGLSDIQLRVEYPDWRGLQIHSLAFRAEAGQNQLAVEVPTVQVAYHLAELVMGTITQVRVPLVAVQVQAAVGGAQKAKGTAALPLAALLSGQWLSDVPIRELLLEQLTVDARTSANAIYTLRLSGQLRDAELQINGDLRLPKPATKPIVFSLKAQHTAEAQLVISSIDQTAAPILNLTVNPVAADDALARNQIKLNGALTARLNLLIPMLLPWLTGADWASGLEGDLTSDWHAQVNDASWQVKGKAKVLKLGGRWQDQVLPRAEWAGNFDINAQRATLQSSLRVEQAVVVEAKGEHTFANGHGHTDLKLLPVAFGESGFVLSRLLKDWPYPFDVNAGRITGSGRLVWQQDFDLQGVVELDKLGGQVKQLPFAGLSGKVALTYDQGVRMTQDVPLRLELLDVGFPVENIAVRFELVPQPKAQLPLVRVLTFSAQLLGGTASSGQFELDFGRDKNAFVVQLAGISLNEIMKLEQQEGLEGSGKLDGQIPIEIVGKEIVVTHGQMSAIAPGGVIRYTPTPKVAALAQSNQSIGMMVKALSNFQYQVLEVSSDYKPGGDLILQVRLEGKNPAWQAGQPIHLNLNLQENIPTLLRSLQLSDEITGQVQKRYQKPDK